MSSRNYQYACWNRLLGRLREFHDELFQQMRGEDECKDADEGIEYVEEKKGRYTFKILNP